MKNICTILVSLLFVPFITVAQQRASMNQQLTPLEQLLQPDGALNFKKGFRGSVDVKGWKIRTDRRGQPQFFRGMRSIDQVQDDDSLWENQPEIGFDNTIRAFAFGRDGDLYVGGEFNNAGGVPANYVARWDGMKWYSLGAGMNRSVLTLAVDSSGNILAGGRFDSAGGVRVNYIARWDGTSWSALGTGMSDAVRSLAVNEGGDVYAGGSFDSAGGVVVNYIARWDGEGWNSVGGGMNNSVLALAVQGTTVYAGGTFTSAGGVVANRIAFWNGSNWQPMIGGFIYNNNGMNDSVFTIFPSGSTVFVGGAFTTAGGWTILRFAIWASNDWWPLGDFDNSVLGITVIGTQIFACGYFNTAGGASASSIAFLDWSNSLGWTPLGTGVDNLVCALAASPNGDLCAGGTFINAGGLLANRIASWDGTSWNPILMGFDNTVLALAVGDNGRGGTDVYAGGSFTNVGGVSANRVARWDGTRWYPMGIGMNTDVSTLTVGPDGAGGTYVYAGGIFTTADGTSANYIARWNGTNWSPMGTGMDAAVNAIAVRGSTVYAGGDFTAAGGVSANRVAQWNGTSWSPMGNGMDNPVEGIVVMGETDVYAGGQFTSADGASANYVARWNGTQWSPLGSGLDGWVRALIVMGTDVYAGGAFSNAGDVSANNIARWDTKGSTWSPLGNGTDWDVLAFAAMGTDLYVGGWFSNAGGVSANYVARWNTKDSTWNPLGTGTDFDVYALAVTPSELGKTYLNVGGWFVQAGGKPAYYFSRWRVPGISSITTISLNVKRRWNMISLPLNAADARKVTLFPTATSEAFDYENSTYNLQDTLKLGRGYWLKFSSDQVIPITGFPTTQARINVVRGWNMIGSIDTTIPVSFVTSIPGGLVTSRFFTYQKGYVTVDSIEPGKGYWVKVSSGGSLILSSTPSVSTFEKSAIRIIPTEELPPSPPGDMQEPKSILPHEYALSQSYPNPFNPITTIKYELPVESKVKLVVYNVLGQAVTTLVEEVQNAGYKSFDWNASLVSSGVYFYHLEATGVSDPSKTFTQVKKMLLLK